MMVAITMVLLILTTAVVCFGGKAVCALQVFGVALTENAEKQRLATAQFVNDIAEHNQRVRRLMARYARAVEEHTVAIGKADEAIVKLVTIAEGVK